MLVLRSTWPAPGRQMAPERSNAGSFPPGWPGRRDAAFLGCASPGDAELLVMAQPGWRPGGRGRGAEMGKRRCLGEGGIAPLPQGQGQKLLRHCLAKSILPRQGKKKNKKLILR